MHNTMKWEIYLVTIFVMSIGNPVNGLICLRCSDVTEPRLCDKVEYCSRGEVCAVQMYRADNGDIGYWTGCMPQQDCTTIDNRTAVSTKRSMFIDGEVTCKDCCTNDICNSYGCGSPQYPNTRGPICFECRDVRHPSECHKIVPCSVNERCFIEERIIFGQKYFTSKCEAPTGCNQHFTGPIVGKRDVSSPCLHCCQGDLCNSNCSSIAVSFPPSSGGTATQSPPYIAFHAVLTSDRTSGIIVFNQVLTNIGNAYDNTTGVFTAISDGTYIFSWSVETYAGRTDTVLEVNGTVKGTATADQSSSYYDTSTSFAVLELNAGDKVNIRVRSGTAKSTRTMFSGWKYNSTDNISAFYASANTRLSGSRFQFNNVYTNQNSVYSSSNGYFTAPQSGLYVFTSSISIYGSVEYNYHIYTKGSKNYDIWVDSASGRYDSSGSMHVAFMNTGDRAYVGAGSSDHAETGSMFAGWMAAPGSPSNYPAFIASLPSNSRTSPIPFSRTYITPHHGYDTTGIFTVTRNGVYVFLWNIEAHSEVTTTSLRVNGLDRGQTRSDGRHSGYDDSAAVSVVELKVKDLVSVTVLSGTADSAQTVFCGWLLFEQ